ncbi:hypothetical protein BDR22DRAFT_826308 [Usnea florida]
MATKKRKRFTSAKKARKDEDRRRRLQSITYLSQSASQLQNRFRKQSRRWLRHQLKTPSRGDISVKVEKEIYYFLKTSNASRLSAEARRILSRLDVERAGAREAAAVEGLGWVDDWFDGGDEDVGLELDAGGDEGGKNTREEEDDEQNGRGRVFLSPEPGAGAEGEEVLWGERETGEGESMKLPFRGFVSG